MKSLFILLINIFGSISNISAQVSVINIYNINDSRQNKTETIINSEKISGQPFFIDEWCKGTVVLENGKIYDNYLLKYNIYNQTLLFQQGKESIEIDQQVKEFFFEINNLVKFHFLKGSIYNTKQTGFFELVDDNKECQLLRLNKKVGVPNSEKFTNITESKAFQNTIEYFIFNKLLNKFSSYKKADPSLKGLYELHLL